MSAQRRKEIFHLLNTHGQVELNDLAQRFGVSAMTIRRDLEKLEEVGKAKRVHGGAVLSTQTWEPESITQKSITNIHLKQVIAQTALRIIQPGSSIFLDAGSTTYEIANAIRTMYSEPLTICTSDVRIANLLAGEERLQVYICGGSLDTTTASAGGHFAIQMIMSLHADLAIIGCDGLTIHDGAMSSRITQVEVKQAMLARSLKSALVADSTKFGRVSFASIAPLRAFDYIVSDSLVDAETRDALEKASVEVVLPDPATLERM
ncbi:DeoR/GlpR transcriptional regulator [Alicyclobacillus cycloheptanicus]|uniref:DeoR/GlpR family DNA-binding transcription regulator n=1 Tax=Alicyclobacillus cycloheptanicus TaxID=1457 RepID=UPI002378BB7E|nr:DeoR/GlpR family DNA-binding transcription regulator [Alicyclobacillus cycloheptanicus]WDM02171.1 DeoR/GlpR transcriptional regulator [Alicyclobacillus cycloheptanicus]